MQKIFLIRHGETICNVEKKYCGFTESDLTKTGILQSEILADRLKDEKIDNIYASDMKRTLKTARIIFKKNKIIKATALREMNFGCWENKTYQELCSSKYKDLYSKWLDDPLSISIPKGESLQDLEKRIMKLFNSAILEHKDKKIAFVTHGGPIRVILCSVLGKKLSYFWKIKLDPGSLTCFEYKDGKAKNLILNEIIGEK